MRSPLSRSRHVFVRGDTILGTEYSHPAFPAQSIHELVSVSGLFDKIRILIWRGGRNRTLVAGFGDRSSTTELLPLLWTYCTTKNALFPESVFHCFFMCSSRATRVSRSWNSSRVT